MAARPYGRAVGGCFEGNEGGTEATASEEETLWGTQVASDIHAPAQVVHRFHAQEGPCVHRSAP